MKSDEPIYLVGLFAVEDMERLSGGYIAPLQEINARHEIEVLAASPAPEVIEGEPDDRLTVILKFASRGAFDAWYQDPGYQTLIDVRQAVTDTERSSLVLLKPGRS